MSVKTKVDAAGAAMCLPPVALRRKRGTTLVEMVLYISLVSLVITFSLGLLREEQVRGERASLAAELKQVTSASQAYVAANYENLVTNLFTNTANAKPMIAVHPISDVVAAGFLPQGFAGASSPKSFVNTLNYALVLRAVLRNDPATTPVTVDKVAAIKNPTNALKLKDELINRSSTDDEIDLEVLLVTTSDDPCVILPAVQGPRITAEAETMAAGFVTGPGAGKPTGCTASVANDPAWDGTFQATGPHGSWTLPLERYKDLKNSSGDPVVQAGRLASLIALQKRPALSEGAAIAGAGDSAFRCADVTPNTPQHLACRQSKLMYSGIKLAAWDSDGNGSLDKRPGLENVHSISLAAPDPAVVSGAQIRDVLSLACGTGGTTTSTPNELNVDCPQTKLQGLVVSLDASFAKDVNVTGDVTAVGDVSANDAKIANALFLKGQNIESKFVTSKLMKYATASSLSVPKPTCPGGFSPAIAATVVSLEAQDLRKQEVISNSLPGSWAVDLKLTVGAPAYTTTTAVTTNTNPIGSELLVQTWCQ
jgi:hypothetical protein